MTYPLMAPLKQRLFNKALTSVETCAREKLREAGLKDAISPGDRIAITAGSRGIRSIVEVLRGVVREVEACGGKPFIVPAMGSHGGATAEGQIGVLSSLGVTEDSVGAPIRSSMETETVGETERGHRVFVDRNAMGADGIVVVNRVKPHTDFRNSVESGLIKMMAIGLGKKDQAEEVHSMGSQGLREVIPQVAGEMMRKAPFRMGLAIMDNGYGDAAELIAMKPGEIAETEPRLLKKAKNHASRLPFDEIDILIVDYMGKEISGAGLDTNVIGRLRIGKEPWLRKPVIQTILLLDLTDASHGNAVGVGLGDLATERLANKIDRDYTMMNLMVSTFAERGTLPPVFATDRDAFDAATYLHRRRKPEDLKVVRIKSTLHLETIRASEALLRSGVPRNCVMTGPSQPLAFLPDGSIFDHSL